MLLKAVIMVPGTRGGEGVSLGLFNYVAFLRVWRTSFLFPFYFLFPSTVLIMKLAPHHSMAQSRCGAVSFVHFPGCFSLFGALQKEKKEKKDNREMTFET